ncbi:uncharacterized protein LOC117169134 isoform X2 [Belonocnema kinseyi]|uniref:uncharacterized protein LOC117169134 isoform X2 n=1 Tax=Belonocnema kinseyi TaxID=2817044 RepID=UPI00143D6389|nr:uncharacterized protein LOC117169134 isoform X2 [Belonocnema kinseyi]
MSMMANFTLFYFLVTALVSQVLGRIAPTDHENNLRVNTDLEYDISKKTKSFALASIDEAQYLPSSQFMRKVLKGVALDLASLRKNVKKTLLSLDNLSGKSEIPNSQTSSPVNSALNGFELALDPKPATKDLKNYMPNNQAQMSSANFLRNFGKLVDNSVYNSASQSGTNVNPWAAFSNSGQYPLYDSTWMSGSKLPDFNTNPKKIA